MAPTVIFEVRGPRCNVECKQVRAENGRMGSLHVMLAKRPDASKR